MVQTKGRLTDRAIRAFAREVEKWKEDFEPADSVMDFEELLGVAVAGFDAISHWDVIWHAKVNAGQMPYDQATSDGIEETYRGWLSPSWIVIGSIERFERAGIRLSGAEKYRRCVAEAAAILNPSDDVSGGIAVLQMEAIESHRRGDTVPMEWTN